MKQSEIFGSLDALSRRYIASLQSRSRPVLGKLVRSLANDYSNEILYQKIVSDVIRYNDLDYIPMPTKGAANYSLLYTLYRTIIDTDVTSVLELGIGQSTLFLDRLKRLRNFEISSFEHDKDWCDFVRTKVEHNVTHSLLAVKSVRGFEVPSYDFSSLKEQRFDLILVDGPIGSSRRSRWCALELLTSNLKDDFIVIFDDADRRPEFETVAEAIRAVSATDRKIFVNVIHGFSSQILLMSEKYKFLQHI